MWKAFHRDSWSFKFRVIMYFWIFIYFSINNGLLRAGSYHKRQNSKERKALNLNFDLRSESPALTQHSRGFNSSPGVEVNC